MPEIQQTTPACPPRLSDRVAIGVLTQSYPPALVDRVLAECGRVERRQRLRQPGWSSTTCSRWPCLPGVAYEEVLGCLVEGLRGRRGGPTHASRGRPGGCRPSQRWSRPAPGWGGTVAGAV
jgi:transposase IS4-like protein